MYKIIKPETLYLIFDILFDQEDRALFCKKALRNLHVNYLQQANYRDTSTKILTNRPTDHVFSKQPSNSIHETSQCRFRRLCGSSQRWHMRGPYKTYPWTSIRSPLFTMRPYAASRNAHPDSSVPPAAGGDCKSSQIPLERYYPPSASWVCSTLSYQLGNLWSNSKREWPGGILSSLLGSTPSMWSHLKVSAY